MDSWVFIVILGLIHGLAGLSAANTSDKADVANVAQEPLQKEERPKPTKCILCGGLLRVAARGPYLYCASGHKRLNWHGDNRWFTRDDDVAERLQAKGLKVMSAPPAGWFGTRYFIES
jgi:hypothetical protein